MSQTELKMITEIFAPQNENEIKTLLTIAKESVFIDIKPYSHNTVSLNLHILEKTHHYNDDKIKLVLKFLGLDKKGWGDEDEESL